MEVEGHAEGVGLLLLPHPVQNVQKSVDGVGVFALLGGEQPPSVQGPVDDGVPVEDH